MKTKITKIILLSVAIILMIFGIYQIFGYEVSKTQGISSQKNAVGTGTLGKGEKNPSSYSYNINTGEWEAIYGSQRDVPIYPGFQIYCMEYGLINNWEYQIRYNEALKLVGKKYKKECGQHAETPNVGDTTPPVYKPAGVYTLSPAQAYVVSDQPIGAWSDEKQEAIWALSKGGTNDYAKYDPQVRNKGLKPTDKTKIDDVYTKVNQDTEEYTVGPFNMTYTEGIYGKTTFAGISEMKVIGYNSDKQVVDDNIKIKKFILKDKATGTYGKAVTPQYFEPDSSLKIDETEQVYPKSGQDFQIVFDDPNAGLSESSNQRVAYISIKVKFKYMLANGKYTRLIGTKYTVFYHHNDAYNPHTHTECTYKCHTEEDEDGEIYEYHYDIERNCWGCITTGYLQETHQQEVMAADAIRSIYEQEIEIGKDGNIIKISTTMDLGGHVWEDGVATKESKADGVSNTSGNMDRPLKNVKVTLYTSNGRVATLLSDPTESGITNDKLMHRINPTYTDGDGNYLFEGLDPMKKYYVRFEYNGQIYLPTEYLNTANGKYSSVSAMVNAGLYNTGSWEVTSKGTETSGDRNYYDKNFKEIGSYPENYNSSNSLGKIGNKNATFSQKDLMGYTLDRNGKYRQTGIQLIDGYLYSEDGLQTSNYREGVISEKVRRYIRNNERFPSESAMKSIYSDIAGNNLELWRKLQFIEDCKISSYTQPQDRGQDLYPVYDHFRINHAIGNEVYETAEEAQNGDYDMKSETLDGVRYRPIYPGQFFVNQGLWRRQEFDNALWKDAYRAVMKINNKTVVYKYDTRNDDEKYWDINVRMADYDSYYNTGYNREIYRTDYEYSSKDLKHPGADLEIYVTYKITIRNQSQSIMNQVNEVVDYYDKDYTYRDDLSWVTYIGDNKKNTVKDDEYYNAMVAEDVSKIANARPTKASTTSKYGKNTHSDIEKNYKSVYVRGLEDKKLGTGETAYVYLTFQVNKENGKVILDDESSPKMNYAEVNGYTTYYGKGTELPNGISKGPNDIAGLIDRDSNPGNLIQSDLEDKDRYERNFEDDTDRAKAVRTVIDEDAVRKANGTVWEDERTVKAGDSIVGDGIRQDKETKVQGVTVQLVEKTIDGKEYIWQETTTDEKGYYSFEKYIPGDYIIRFYYGNNVATTKIKGNGDYTAGGQNDTSYNGQDFKSTTYQKGIKQPNYTDKSNRYTGYKNVITQNETGTYGYDIYTADSNKNNVSDAKDLWSVSNKFEISYKPGATVNERKAIRGRQSVISYSNQNVTNHKAEVLASPYETPLYNGTKYNKNEMNALVNELIANTYMTAETGVIAVEFEYDRQQSEGQKVSNGSDKYLNGNDVNGKYELNNIDLGLAERPKAQLELDKSIANLKITLANGSVLFDVNKAGDNVIWKDHTEYNLASKKDSKGKYNEYYGKTGKNRYSYREEVNNLVRKSDKGLIQVTMDEELMHGATIEVNYKLKVTNVGEVDYEGQKYYYLADTSGANQVTTVANGVVDYVANNLKFNGNHEANQKWTIIQNTSLIPQKNVDNDANLVNRRLDDKVKQFNNIIQTDGFNKALKPGENAEKTLILTQLISTENKSDDLTYSNMAEIAKISNTVGRRMAYSVVGNQDPKESTAKEVDSSMAERIIILPPFGNTHIFYMLGAIIAIILAGGIIFIIRKVLKK